MGRFGAVLLILLGVLSCGKQSYLRGRSGNLVNPPPGPKDSKHVSLIIFGAPWCSHCKTDFPEINTLLKNELTGRKRSVNGVMYVPTGNSAGEKPTQEAANQYRDFLKLDFEARIDEWPWKNFKKYIQNKPDLPAGIVFDEQGNVLKIFPPGKTTFVPQKIADFVKSQL